MELIILSAKVCDPNSPWNQKKVDIRILDNKIASIQEAGTTVFNENSEKINAEGYWISPGFMDLRANFRDPGFETKEDIESGAAAAAAGGFTKVAVLPELNPIAQNKSDISYLIEKGKKTAVDILPIAALSHNLEGKEISEMYDLKQAGAIAYSEGNNPVSSSGLLMRGLLYGKTFDALIMVSPEDKGISGKGQMNESLQSVILGMKGIPNLTEVLAIKRDLELLRYTESKIHFSHISSKEAVNLIAQAKKEGLKVTCDVAAHQLLYTDSELKDYNTNFKVKPPFRSEGDREALIDGILNGIIDVIISDHQPEDLEHKEVEFEYAAPGIASIQTVLHFIIEGLADKFNPDLVVQTLSVNPRKISGLEIAKIAENENAELVIWSNEKSWLYNSKSNKSKAVNNPLWNTEIKGKVLGTFHKNKWNQNN